MRVNEELTLKTLNVLSKELFLTVSDTFNNDTFKRATDLNVNPNGEVWVSFQSGERINKGVVLRESTIMQIATLLASFSSQSLNEETPYLSTTWPGTNKRVEIIIPPIVSSPIFSIRLHNPDPFNINELVGFGMLTSAEALYLEKLVLSKKNIVIAGATGSGKTTLLNALCNLIPKTDRVVIIEEATREIKCNLPDVVNIITNKRTFTGQMALKSSMRLNPDRIIYGETRDGESALEALKAWRTGHPGGFSTIHANSARGVIGRFEDLLREVCQGDMSSFIKDSVDVALYLEVVKGKRILKEKLDFKKG